MNYIKYKYIKNIYLRSKKRNIVENKNKIIQLKHV